MSLIFVLGMIPLKEIIQKIKLGCVLGRGKRKRNVLLFMDDLELFMKPEVEPDSPVQSVWILFNDIKMEIQNVIRL